MSDKGFPDWRLTQRKIAMSEKVGKLLEFMQETACVHVKEREVIGWLDAYGMINPEDEDFKKFLKEVAKPVLIRVGRAKWYRDTITDLGFALSAKEATTTEEDVSKVLDAEKR